MLAPTDFILLKKVENVEAIASATEPIDVLKINSDDVGCVLMIVKAGSPWLVRFEVSGSDGLRLSGSVRGLGGWGEHGGRSSLHSNM